MLVDRLKVGLQALEAEAGQIGEFRLIGTVWLGDPIGIKLVNQEDLCTVVVISRNSGR